MKIDLKNSLNDKQYEAASQVNGPLLIIAGAGSGKTRMLTYRIAAMIKNSNISPKNILALTFTNKAAREMKERIKELTDKSANALTVSTFHSFGVKILRENTKALGYERNFSIYDTTDKSNAIKEAAREIKMPVDDLNLYELNTLFSDIKTKRKDWNAVDEIYKPLYETYIKLLKAYNAVDFDDLITLPIEIFKNNEDILKNYQRHYKYILVDEFQDTSLIQYEIVQLLAQEHRNLCVVGDDDQSIYSWRGANYKNIEFFERDFPELTEIKLEQNYRSTKNILDAANTVISNNSKRKDKKLWTGGDSGKAIEIFYPENEVDEGQFIADTILALKVNSSLKYSDFGILIRTNTLCTNIEEFLLEKNIPYTISGGSSFFQRKEIKDVVAYLKLISNFDDDINLLRIINTPRRGFGIKSIEKIRSFAKNNRCSIFSALKMLSIAQDTESIFSKSITNSIIEFVELIEKYQVEFSDKNKNLSETFDEFIKEINYLAYIINDNKDKEKLAKFKINNINKFSQMIERWESDSNNDSKKISLPEFLNRITLITNDDNSEDDDSDLVNLMTIHASKGLEFSIVFLAGVEADIIPHKRSIEEDPQNIEEERRLFYVAITRAKQHLFLLSCKSRKNFKGKKISEPSPFIDEIPKDLITYHDKNKLNEDFDAKDFLKKLSASLG